MQPTENFKDVTINGRNFRIKKFNALIGGFMLIKITGILAPLFKGLDLGKLQNAKSPDELSLDTFNIVGILSELGSLSEKDFAYVQGKCLEVCSEVLPAGLTPVLNENGTFGVLRLEEDTMTVMALVVHALVFNVTGFFQGSPLASIVGGFLTTTPQG